jgi:hypothetical protein
MTARPLHQLPGRATDSAALDDALRAAIGYRIVGAEGDLGTLLSVPEAGRPLRPLVLVVGDEHTMRLIS